MANDGDITQPIPGGITQPLPKAPKNTGIAQGQVQTWEDLSHILPAGGVEAGFQLRHEIGPEEGSGSVHLHGPNGKWLARAAYTGKGTDNPQWVFHAGDQMTRQPRVHTPVVNHLARALGHVFRPRAQFQGLLDEARESESWNRDLDGAESMLKAEGKKGGTWAGRPILSAEDAQGLEAEAALREFRDRRPRAEAEEDAHRQYRHGHHQKAAAHHLRGMKMAQASGQVEEAHKHSVMYALHLQKLGHDPYKEPPAEVRALLSQEPDQKQYRYKDHGGDGFLLEKGEDISSGLVLKKAWPKDEDENQTNAAVHSVLEDHLLEQGAQKLTHSPEEIKHKVRLEDARVMGRHAGVSTPEEQEARDRVQAASDANWGQDQQGPVPTNEERVAQFRSTTYHPDEPVNAGSCDECETTGHPKVYTAYNDGGERVDLCPNCLGDSPFHWDPEDTSHEPANTRSHTVYPNTGSDQDRYGEKLFWGAIARAAGLKKAWPKDDQENQVNAAANMVAQDHLLELGAERKIVSHQDLRQQSYRDQSQVARAGDPTAPWDRDVYHQSLNNMLTARRANNAKNPEDEKSQENYPFPDQGPHDPTLALEDGERVTPSPATKAREKTFWQRIGKQVGLNKQEVTGAIPAPKFGAEAPAPQHGSGLTNTRISDTVIKPKPLPEGVPAPPSLKITPQPATIGGLVPPPAPKGAPVQARPHPLDLGPGLGEPRQISAPEIKPVTMDERPSWNTWKSEQGGLWQTLAKASKNVRANRNSLSAHQIVQRLTDYARRQGFKATMSSGTSPAQIRAGTLTANQRQPITHELGHAFMTPEGQTAREYTRRLDADGNLPKDPEVLSEWGIERDQIEAKEAADHDEDVASVMEAGIARRAGVSPQAVATSYTPEPHKNPVYTSVGEYDDRPPEEVHAQLLESAQHHLNQVDTGQKKFVRGRALPGMSVDARINARAMKKADRKPPGDKGKVLKFPDRKGQVQADKKAKIQETFDEAFTTMSQDPGFKELADQRRREATEAELKAGPARFRPGHRVRHATNPESYPWVGIVGPHNPLEEGEEPHRLGPSYREHDIDGPGHYYNVKWWNPKLGQYHEDWVHQDDLVPDGGPGPVKKAWPKTEKENQANAQGFVSESAHRDPASKAVALDSLNETLGGNAEETEPDIQGLADKQQELLGRWKGRGGLACINCDQEFEDHHEGQGEERYCPDNEDGISPGTSYRDTWNGSQAQMLGGAVYGNDAVGQPPNRGIADAFLENQLQNGEQTPREPTDAGRWGWTPGHVGKEMETRFWTLLGRAAGVNK